MTTENETPVEAVTESVEPQSEVASITDTPETPSPRNADELWDVELKLPVAEDESEATAEPAVEQGDAVSTEPLPEESPNPSEQPTAETDDELEKVLETHDPNKPIPMTRKERDLKAREILEPFRDEATPIEEVFRAMNEFQPVRTQELAEKLVYNSLSANPDAWLEELGRITGKTFVDAATVDSGTPLNTATATDFEAQPENAEVIRQLDEIYGKDAWRDPNNDDEIIGSDLPYVKQFRAQIERDAAMKAAEAQRQEAHNKEIEALKGEVEKLKPQIDEIKAAKEVEFEAKFAEVLQADVDKYRQTVEDKAFPTVFEKLGLKPLESDPDEIKAIKSLMTSRFEAKHDLGFSEFDMFVEKEFSGREKVSKTIQRVGKHLNDAAKLETEAIRSPKQAESLRAQANALRAQAQSEQDALAVWTQKAAGEFIEKDWSAVTTLLKRLSDLERSRGGREEIVSTSAASAGSGLQAKIQQAKAQGINPFDIDTSEFIVAR